MSQRLPDLVQDTKLDTSYVDNYTVHHYDDSDDEQYARSTQRDEYWEYQRRLARGGCGEVWLQKCIQGKRTYEWRAVKTIPKQVNYASELEAIAKFSQRRYSKCFVKLLGWYDTQDALHIAMEFFPLGDLQDYITKLAPMNEQDVRQVTYQVLEGLHYMHREGFAHRDIKPGNILIKSSPPTSGWWVKISDFGISKRIDGTMGVLSTVKGTISYMAPEMFGHEPGGPVEVNYKAADCWSLGEMAFRMLTKTASFPSHGALFRYLARPDLFPTHELAKHNASEQVQSLIRELMKPSPEERLQSKFALQHDFFQPCRRIAGPTLVPPPLSIKKVPSLPSTATPDPWATIDSTASSLARMRLGAERPRSIGSSTGTSTSQDPRTTQAEQTVRLSDHQESDSTLRAIPTQHSLALSPPPVAANLATSIPREDKTVGWPLALRAGGDVESSKLESNIVEQEAGLESGPSSQSMLSVPPTDRAPLARQILPRKPRAQVKEPAEVKKPMQGNGEHHKSLARATTSVEPSEQPTGPSARNRGQDLLKRQIEEYEQFRRFMEGSEEEQQALARNTTSVESSEHRNGPLVQNNYQELLKRQAEEYEKFKRFQQSKNEQQGESLAQATGSTEPGEQSAAPADNAFVTERRCYTRKICVQDFAFTADSHLVIAHGSLKWDRINYFEHGNSMLTVHNLDEDKAIKAFGSERGDQVHRVAVSNSLAGSNKVALALSSGSFEVWSLPDWQPWAGSQWANVEEMAFRPNRSDELAVVRASVVNIWSFRVENGQNKTKQVASLLAKSSSGGYNHVGFSGSGNVLGALSGQTLELWNSDLFKQELRQWARISEVKIAKNRVLSFQLDRWGAQVVSCDSTGLVSMVILSSGSMVWEAPLAFGACFNPTSHCVAVAMGYDAYVKEISSEEVINLSAGTIALNRSPTIKFSPNGRFLIMGSNQGLTVWELESYWYDDNGGMLLHNPLLAGTAAAGACSLM